MAVTLATLPNAPPRPAVRLVRDRHGVHERREVTRILALLDGHRAAEPLAPRLQKRWMTSKGEATMGIIIALIIGLIAGAIAKLLMPGRDPGGIVVTMLIGVAGSVVAYLLGRVVGWYDTPGEGPGIIASILGAMVLLGLYRLAIRRT